MRVARAAAALTGAAVLAVAAGAVYAKPPPKPPKDDPPPAFTFQISGSVDELYPGGIRWMELTLSNQPNAGKLVVTQVGVTSVAVDKDGCDADVVVSDGWTGRARIREDGTATIEIPVRMTADAPDACQGATFILEYTGIGER